MTLQNRVQPDGRITDTPMRGMLMGNRGILHDGSKRLGKARWKSKAWIACALSFKGQKRELMAPRRYTELFFLDEAVALAAGHRPCFECRKAEAKTFKALWQQSVGPAPRAADIDKSLHSARTAPERDAVPMDRIPAGSMIVWQGHSHLVQPRTLLPYTPDGYGLAIPHPDTTVTVLTPAPIRAVLQAGYTVRLHPSATASQQGRQD